MTNSSTIPKDQNFETTLNKKSDFALYSLIKTPTVSKLSVKSPTSDRT